MSTTIAEEEEDENHPAWLSTEYDDKFKGETAPLLFGEGGLDLQDPENPSAEKRQPDAASSSADKKKPGGGEGYGSVGGGGKSDKQKQQQQQQHDDDDDDQMIILGDSSSAAAAAIGKRKAAAAAASASDDLSSSAADGGRGPPQLSEAAKAAKPHVPSINPCLWAFYLLRGVTVITALCLLTTQVIPLVLTPRDEIIAKIGFLSIALKVYIALFCVLFVLVESDLHVPFVRASPILQRFLSRGFVYSFVGLICVEEAYSERVKDLVARNNDAFHVGWAAVFMQISSWFMLGTGTVYMMLGVCCLKRLRDRMRENEIEAWKKYRKDMKEWKDVYGG